MAVTVRDLLDLAFPPGSSVVAGESGLDRQVVWARSLRPRPPAFDAIEGSELALLSGAYLSMIESLSLSYVVGRLADAGVAAIAVLGDLDPVSIQAATQRGVPLIRLPEGVSLTDLERKAIATIVDRQAELQRGAAEIHRQLAQLVFEERGLQAVAEKLAEVCGKAAVIEDDLLRVRFAAPGPHVPAPADLNLGSRGADLAGWLRTVTLSSAQPPVNRFRLPDAELDRFVSPIPSRDGVAGYVSVVGRPSDLTDLDRLAAGRGAAVCAVEVAKMAAAEDAEARVRGDLLDQLLSMGAGGDQSTLGTAQRLGYDLSVPSAVIVFRVEPKGQGTPGQTTGAERARRQLESLVRVEIGRWESKPLVAARGPTVVAVVPLATNASRETLRTLAKQSQTRVQAGLATHWVAAGIGRPVKSGFGLAAAFREAEEAVVIGSRLNGPSSTTHFGDLGIMRLLTQVGRKSELEEFSREMLGTLETHDQKTGSELVKTLEAVFRCHGNLSKAAEQLSLHRNSLLYRLERIADLGGLDLDDPETRLSLQVALKARQLLDAGRLRGE